MTTLRFWISGFLTLVLLIGGGCDSTNPEVRTNPPDALYVCNQASGTVSVIDPDSNAVFTTVDLVETEVTDSQRPKPHHVVVEPDGSAWYVSLINEDAVLKLNAQNEVVGRVSFPSPGMLSLGPNGERLYAGHTLSVPSVSSTIAVIPTDMSDAEVVSVSIDRPHGIKASPIGEYVYTSSLTAKQVVSYNADAENVSFSPLLPGTAQEYIQMDISADGQTAFLTKAFGPGETRGQVHVLSLADPTTPTFVDSIEVGARPWHPQLSADGETLYVGSKSTNAVYAIDTDTYDTATITGEGLAEPHGSALSADGGTLYVSNNNQDGSYAPSSNGTVVAIDTETDEIQAVIEVGRNPAGINTRWRPGN